MASTGGKAAAPLVEDLIRTPHEFEFFQAVRILERYVLEHAPEKYTALGTEFDFHHEPLRFRSLVSLCFPVGQVSSVRQVSDVVSDAADDRSKSQTHPFEVTIPFTGLTGPAGVLPQHYTSLLIERVHQRNKDFAMQEFFDLFNHRIISLFYRAWEKYQFPIGYERSLKDDVRQNDLFTRSLFSLVGLGSDFLRENFAFDDITVLAYGGLFAQRTRSAVALQQIVADFSELPTRVEQFVGQWLRLTDDQKSSLPSPSNQFGMNLELGDSAIVGDAVWDIQSRIRIIIGPVGWADFLSLLPDGSRMTSIQQLVRFYVGQHLDFDIQVLLDKNQVPPCRLGEGDPSFAPRLGWTTWLESPERTQHADDAIFRF